MDKVLLLTGLFTIVIVFNWRAGRLAKRAVAGRAEAEELERALATPVRFLSFLITPSLFFAVVVASGEEEWATGSGVPTDVSWSAAGKALLGCALLLELVARSAGDERALEEPIPELVGLRVMRGLFTSVAGRFFWAALGVAALFGSTADRQFASVLAFDCAMMAAVFALAYRARRGRWERAGRGFCDALDPAPGGAPNMTELTRCFPTEPYYTIRAHDGVRIELGERRLPRLLPIAQAVVAVIAVPIAVTLVAAGERAAGFLPLVAGSLLVALAEREKKRPAYRVSIDTASAVVHVTLGHLDAQAERIALRDARLEVERKDEEGYSTQGRLLLALPGPDPLVDGDEAPSRRLPLLDWVLYPEARRAARALAGHTRLPLDMEEDASFVTVS